FIFTIPKNAMQTLNQKQIESLSHLLDQRVEVLREDLQRETEGKENYIDIANEISEPGMSSFASLAVDVSHAEVMRDVNELKAIDEARERIRNGTYGECIDCLTPIPYERLQAQPTAARCTPCQQVYEKTHAHAAQGPSLSPVPARRRNDYSLLSHVFSA